ncbi:hypothetical protein CASFOL_038195 [Castilleja foliolosa]|uniref:Uncharacterized protein n=1 Tax=Castilleja foliolosa TaxID=1961234 RepID=A0ABD3BL23_9LAMI
METRNRLTHHQNRRESPSIKPDYEPAYKSNPDLISPNHHHLRRAALLQPDSRRHIPPRHLAQSPPQDHLTTAAPIIAAIPNRRQPRHEATSSRCCRNIGVVQVVARSRLLPVCPACLATADLLPAPLRKKRRDNGRYFWRRKGIMGETMKWSWFRVPISFMRKKRVGPIFWALFILLFQPI